MQLTEHFTLEEFACRHCHATKVDFGLVAALEDLRARICTITSADTPLIVTSGYRCPQHPIEKKKARPGMHSTGKAADIHVPGWTARRLYESVRLMPVFRGVGVDDERGYVHVDLRETPARWCYRKDKDVPWSETPIDEAA